MKTHIFENPAAAIRSALADKPARERGGRAGDNPWRYAHESDLSLREMVQELHGCAETVMFLEERRDGDVEREG